MITAFASYQTRPVLWSDIPHRVKLDPSQHAYLSDLYRWLSPGDGLAVPLFGPSGRHGYGGVGWRKPIAPWDPVKRRAVQSIFESFHLRICEIRLSALEKDFELTQQQLRILRVMASGATDAVIAEKVGISRHEIRAAIALTLTSMGVSDRPSAVLRARALGLVDQ
jgi:LuxR family transcriptional regulator/LuxR family quorum-sensing system transcriptional regulator CciR